MNRPSENVGKIPCDGLPSESCSNQGEALPFQGRDEHKFWCPSIVAASHTPESPFIFNSFSWALKRKIQDHNTKWDRYINDWIASNHPNPNEMLTINFPDAEVFKYQSKGKTVSSLRRSIMDDIRRRFRKHGYPWLAVWALETDRWKHVHILLWLPDDKSLREGLAKWLIKRFDCSKPEHRTPLQFLRTPPSGSAVQMTPISIAREYSRTGRCGFEGAADYIVKDLARLIKRSGARQLGKLIGRTRDLEQT